MNADSKSAFSLSYGSIESAIALMCDAAPEAVRVRFRKFRLRDFPDHIQLGSGTRVVYDLPRVLAMCAAFALSDGVMSQTEAAAVVAATWPEWCRALIAAAVDRELLSRPLAMPMNASPAVSLIPTGFASKGNALPLASNAVLTAPLFPPVVSAISIDVRAMLDVIVSAQGVGDIRNALMQLEQTFGWTHADVPMRAGIGDMPPRRGFLDDGPYFDRALMLLDLSETDPVGAVGRWKLKLLSDYLQRPAPLDEWKRKIGDELKKPRLDHLLAVCIRDLGIDLLEFDPETIAACARVDARTTARDMIARSENATAGAPRFSAITASD